MDPEHEEKANEVFEIMARKQVRQMIYDAKNIAISHYYAEQGKRKLKSHIVAEKLGDKVKVEDLLAVSKLSFYSMSILNCIFCS